MYKFLDHLPVYRSKTDSCVSLILFVPRVDRGNSHFKIAKSSFFSVDFDFVFVARIFITQVLKIKMQLNSKLLMF